MKHKATFFKTNSDSSVICTACANYCNLADQQHGKCGVRINDSGVLKILNYGRITTLKEVIVKTHKYGEINALSIGTLGCNFKCTNCLDWDISHFYDFQSRELGREKATSLMENIGTEFSPEKLVGYCKLLGVKAILFSHTEPVVALEYYIEIMKEAHKSGILNIWETNGYFSTEALDAVVPYVDIANVSLHAITPEFYKKHYKTNINIVTENIYKLYQSNVNLEITNILIPDENDRESDIKKLAVFLYKIDSKIPLIFKKFYPNYRMNDKEMTSGSALINAFTVAQKIGLSNIYISD
jgi:pyruvate formate lyase activating enzyme